MLVTLSPFRRPRLWGRLAAVAAFAVSAWLLLVPITVHYESRESFSGQAGAPATVVDTSYSWWSNQNTLLYLAPDESGTVSSTLLDCGTTFSTGDYEDRHQPDGPRSCSAVEAPRRFVGIGLVVLSAAGLVGARKVPAERLTRRQVEEERRLTR